MDLVKALIKRILCKHDYEFRSRAYGVNCFGNLVGAETYQCTKCGKRKEEVL